MLLSVLEVLFQYLPPDLSVGKVCKVGLLSSQPCAKSCSKQARIRDVNKCFTDFLLYFSSTLLSSSTCVSILSFLVSQYSLNLCSCVFLVLIYVRVCVELH